MRRTKTARIAMLRLADILGWEVESSGRTWIVRHPDTYRGLKFNSTALFCSMVRVAMASERIGGLGWSPQTLRDRIRFTPRHYYRHGTKNNPGRCRLACEGDLLATDETTMYRAFFNPDEVRA